MEMKQIYIFVIQTSFTQAFMLNVYDLSQFVFQIMYFRFGARSFEYQLIYNFSDNVLAL